MADKTDKPEFVDTIGDATTQRYRRVMPRVITTVFTGATITAGITAPNVEVRDT